MTQHIRPSQFVITYGPGAILESIDGPRVIPISDIGIFRSGSGLSPDDFEITDRRMASLLGNNRIFRLPTNAELELTQEKYLYETKPFPEWKLCLNTAQHDQFYILHRRSQCPICGPSGKRQEPIRFIVACQNGHMDDFDWSFFLHGTSSVCSGSDYFRWYGGGGSLSRIYLECPKCRKRSESFGKAYESEWNCSGRLPETEPLNGAPNRLGCSKRARIIQRQASNLRIPELRTLFSIPPAYTKLHSLLSTEAILDNIIGHTPTSIQELKEILKNLAENKRIQQRIVDEILQCDWEEIKKAMEDVKTPVNNSYGDMILEEFRALVDASINGAPPLRGPKPSSPVLFHVNPALVLRFRVRNGIRFRVTPVLRLRTVIVQTGYRREVYTESREADTTFQSKLVPVGFSKGDKKWYPGVEFYGEGIFIMFDDDGWSFRLKGEAAQRWENACRTRTYQADLFRDGKRRDELHPLFVWWHTMSHLLIRTISAYAGYSSASIRERVYFEETGERQRGGILLYATQPGSEGTLGGLIALVPHFQEILDQALDMLSFCSVDPLCIEQKFELGKYNGAACYGCLLLSETSCEHRNMWLDRNILLENAP